MVVFGQKWLYSKKSGCIRAKVFVFGQSCLIRINWLYSVKIVVFRQKWFYSGNKVVFGKKMVLFGQSGIIQAK